mgnify:CR=1 FL=1
MYYDELFEKALAQAKEENFKDLKEEVADLQRGFEAFLNKFFNSTTHNIENDYHVTAM